MITLYSLETYYPLFVLGAAGFIILALGILRAKSVIYASVAFAAFILSFFLILYLPHNVNLSDYFVFNDFTVYFALLFIVSSAFITYPALRNIGNRSEITKPNRIKNLDIEGKKDTNLDEVIAARRGVI